MKRLFLALSVLLMAASPCYAVTIHGPEKDIEVKLERIRGAEYVPLVSICDAFGLSWQWDGVGRIITLEKDGVEIVLKIGSSKIYTKEGFVNLGEPLEISDYGVVLVPLGISRKLPKLFSSPYVKEEKPKKVAKKPEEPSSGGFKIKKIALDAGHGGKDPGAVRFLLIEKNITLDVTRRVAAKLEEAGIDVILTRTRDIFVPLSKRADISNRENADFFVSIHANASRSKNVNGFEVYYLSEALDDNARALEASENEALQFEEKSIENHTKDLDATLWDLVLTENRKESVGLARAICKAASENLSTRNVDVKCARFYVLKGAKMPAVLVEMGYISNSKEASKIKRNDYRERIAETIAKGILDYKKEYDRTNGFTN